MRAAQPSFWPRFSGGKRVLALASHFINPPEQAGVPHGKPVTGAETYALQEVGKILIKIKIRRSNRNLFGIVNGKPPLASVGLL